MEPMMPTPASRVVVITGASAGVGRATANAFAKCGFDVGLIARGSDGSEYQQGIQLVQHQLLHDNDGQRTFAIVLDSGDEVIETLQSFAEQQRITAAQFTAIGALSDVVLMYFDWQKKDYIRIPVNEQVEVASMIGDVAKAPSGGSA